jgi:hypothetical protein
MPSNLCQRLRILSRPFTGRRNMRTPCTPLSKNYDDLMKADIPSSLNHTANRGEFLIKHAWINELAYKSLIIVLSDVSVDIMRRSPVWLIDGTFATSPAPFHPQGQVKTHMFPLVHLHNIRFQDVWLQNVHSTCLLDLTINT